METHTYRVHGTPLGAALLVGSPAGLVRLTILDGSHDAEIADLSLTSRAPVAPDDTSLASACEQLDEFFDGERRGFSVPIDWSFADGFTRDVLRVVCDIPYGQTASYGEVAVLAGRPRAHRAVGTICAHTPISIVIPAHRVIRSDGSAGGYGAYPERKQFLLDLEARHA